ncbi:hypothetical protein A2617_01280 [Candidatus Daviesbacteria bacterium RIFOXYD1_FULL_41_10]|uniref:Antitoxin n=2 Tax=Candidatus Daviesiibacteriota TaxID=1752718 RepID=A0A1F5N086_9BACT|nr:MAG: hypothetical protein UU67_C0006G0015 [Candidatus Daviesbacteria bacterium GW2011_GWB1_41_5]OGE71056.1 MAG: hypothetical protein A2617_01280 [Candidatus Daviesbacteria bacterium RIFOXYD1_FULL_41_10]
MKKYKLDEKEKQLLEEIEKGEWKPVKDFPKQKKMYEKYARNFLNKNKNINLRISERDLSKIKAKAIEEGMPYQTLAASILHKFVNQ